MTASRDDQVIVQDNPDALQRIPHLSRHLDIRL
jgi:hypothetical protein